MQYYIIIITTTTTTAAAAVASYPGSLIIAGEEKRAWFQSLTHAPIAPEFWGQYTTVIFRLMYDVSSRFI